MTSNDTPAVVVVGSIGIDTVETSREKREEILGGSASFACVASSFFSTVGMVGVVGTDFPEEYRNLYLRHEVDLEGLQTEAGKTFRWSGVYEENMDNRRTLSTDLNVFEQFSPRLPEGYKACRYLFLANISPSLQLHVLDEVSDPKFVLADTMDLWIDIAQDDLRKVIARVDMLTLNESEARHLTGKYSLIKAARELLALGPKYVLIKKGEHGSMLFSEEKLFLMPAYVLEEFEDPTGAGDTFAGAFIGALAAAEDTSESAIRRAMLRGSVVASFGVERFSLDGLDKLSMTDIERRVEKLHAMIRCD